MLHLLSALAPVLGSPVLAPAPRDAFIDATRVPGSCDKSVPPTSKSVSLDAELYFINLESRPDRKVHLIEQLESVGYDKTHVHHFPAVANGDGAYGCMLSHMAVLEKIAQGDAPLGIVMEDDFTFFDAEQASLQLKRATHLSVEGNVVLLSCSHPHVTGWGEFNASDDRAASTVLSQYDLTGQGECAVETLSDHFAPVLNCQTTSGYIITYAAPSPHTAPGCVPCLTGACGERQEALRADAAGSLQGSGGASGLRSTTNSMVNRHDLEVSSGARVMRCTPDAASCTAARPDCVHFLALPALSPSPNAPQTLQVPDQWLITSPVMGYQMEGYSSITNQDQSYHDPETGVPVNDARAQAQPADA